MSECAQTQWRVELLQDWSEPGWHTPASQRSALHYQKRVQHTLGDIAFFLAPQRGERTEVRGVFGSGGL